MPLGLEPPVLGLIGGSHAVPVAGRAVHEDEEERPVEETGNGDRLISLEHGLPQLVGREGARGTGHALLVRDGYLAQSAPVSCL